MSKPTFPTSIPRARRRRQVFFVARVRDWCQQRRLWGKFQTRWVDVYRGFDIGGQEGSWRSFLATCAEFAVDMEEVRAAWRVYRQANLATLVSYAARQKLTKAVQSMQAFQIAEKALTVEREREQMNVDEAKTAARLRESIADQIREETKAMLAEASLEAARRQPPPSPQPIAEPLSTRELPVIEEDTGQVDLLRDVRWVYANLPRLIVRADTGQLKLNIAALKKAPSNGAVSLAEYALRDRDTFFERFVIKLLPRDTTSADDAVAEAQAPSFSPLAEFVKHQAQDEDEGEDALSIRDERSRRESVDGED